MDERVRTRESHSNVTWPRGPRGRHGQPREASGRPLPATFAGGSEEAWQEAAREEVRPSEADEPRAQGEVRLEVSRGKVELRGSLGLKNGKAAAAANS